MTSTEDPAPARQAGAQWVRCALQVNPYAYHEVNRPASLPVGGEDDYNVEMVAALRAEGVGLVGITDHWRAVRSEALRAACEAAGITVLPGFEATTSEGVHVLVLFDPNTRVDELNQRIGECGVSFSTGRSVPGNLSARDLFKRARDWKAVAIPAHVTGDDGLLTTLSGTVRALAVTSSDLFAVALGGGEPEVGQLDMLSGTAPEYCRAQPLAVLRAADVHGPADVGYPAATCWVRLSSMSAAGLARAVRSPQTRVRTQSPDSDAHPRLVELSVEGGFLDGLQLPFNDELNVLIGGRGSGKSTVLECIRFALDQPALTARGRTQHEEVVKHVLKTASKVTLVVDCGHPTRDRYRIERTQGGPSRVLDLAGHPQSSTPSDVLPGVEIYGQRELADVAEDPEQQSALLRRLLPASAQSTVATLGRELALSRDALARVDREIAALDEALAELPAVQERLDRLGGAGVADRLGQQSQLQRQDRTFETANERGNQAREALALLTEMTSVDVAFAAPAALADLPDQAVLTALAPALTGLADELRSAQQQATAAVSAYDAEVARLRAQLATVTEDRRAVVNAQLRALAADGIDGREYLALERRLAGGHALRQNRDRFRREREELGQRRQQLVADQENEQGVDVRRLQGKAREVTNRLAGLLRIEVVAKPDVEAIKQALVTHTGGRLTEVVRAVQAGDVTALQLATAGRGGVTALQKLLSSSGAAVSSMAQTGEPLWRALEEIPGRVVPTIELNIGTSTHPEWREISHLSAGQKATAMLILLLHHGAGPLLIDQPEDDLDNAFVSAEIVPRLRDTKTRRQFVLCTHNANIPVLGDADLVAALTVTRDSDRARALLPASHLGSLDTPNVQELVEDLLEGGQAAFETRRYRYGF